jgi:Gpi18-like mannosyltransferase
MEQVHLCSGPSTPGRMTTVISRASLLRTLQFPPVLAWLTHLALVLATSAFTVAFTPERDKFRPKFDGIAQYLVSPLAVWDGGWYVRIADQGYGSRPDASAFWPLYPFILSVGHEVTGLPFAVIGVVVSNLCFLIALIALFRLVAAEYDRQIASRAVWLMSLWPLGFFFSAVYTESLFVMLVIGSFALGRTGNWTFAAMTAALAVLTRNVGVVLIPCLIAALVQQRGWHPRAWWRQGIQLAASALALVPFAWHIDRIWGDPLLPIRALCSAAQDAPHLRDGSPFVRFPVEPKRAIELS